MMKTYFILLNTLSALFIMIFCSNCSANDISNTNSAPSPIEIPTKDITSYFMDYLKGDETLYNTNTLLSLAQIDSIQQVIWETWRKANNNFVEQKLIDLNPLEIAKNGSWNLPANLEPNAIMPYYWGSKGDNKPTNGYPMYLYMHGSGDKEGEWSTGLSICKKFDDMPSVYFIPQIPNTGDYYRWWQKAKQFAWEKLLRLAFISGEINPNKVFFFGISEGGYGSQRLGSFYADYLAGAGPMAGGEPLKNAPVENYRNIAFSFLTGEFDNGFYRNKLTQYTKDEFDRLQAKYPTDFVNRIELVPGMGHGLDYSPTTQWLKTFERNPYPKQVSWENFEMDGIYRKGFYNIYVKERSNHNSMARTFYNMDIKDNHIELNVDLVTYQTVETDPQWGIELKFTKDNKPATKGKVIIYLCDQLVDLSKEITLTVNGKKAFKGMVKSDLKHIVNSCATFFDPERLYPTAIEIDIADIQ